MATFKALIYVLHMLENSLACVLLYIEFNNKYEINTFD